MHRFFVPSETINQGLVTITGEQAHQIARVLRFKTGDRLMILDNSGYQYETEILEINRERVTGKIVKKERGAGEPATTVILYQALIKPDKFEFLLQKGVELGVTQFWTVLSERCTAAEPSTVRVERWQNIIREATEQSRRPILPTLCPTVAFELACKSSIVLGIILWEEEVATGISQVLQSSLFKESKLVRVFVGPEGGFTAGEIGLARQRGIIPVSLGNRILRAETAGLAAITAIMYEKGELG